MTIDTMNVQDLQHRLSRLEDRSGVLEKQNKRLRIAGLLVLAIGLAVMLGGGGWMGNDLLEARGLMLRSPDGKLRGSFVVSDDGGVRLTLVDNKKKARAGLWLDPDGECSIWGFDNMHMPGPHGPSAQLSGSGKLITVASDSRVLERRRDKWVYGYMLTLRNDTGQNIDQAFHVNLVDTQGYVLGRQARMLRLAPNQTATISGEINLATERAGQVQEVQLAMFEN